MKPEALNEKAVSVIARVQAKLTGALDVYLAFFLRGGAFYV